MSPAPVLHFLCAGASQGLVKALQQRFGDDTGATLQGRFGAVGAMKEALLAGEPCDLMVLTGAMIDALCSEGHL
ncbi:MAG: substrate-binding domain-containing protein, partial [Rubrivivax sp.]